MKGHSDCVYTVVAAKNSEMVYSGAGDGMVVRWSLQDPENGKLIAKVNASVYALAYQPQSNCLLIGQNYDGIHFIDVDDLHKNHSIKITDKAIFDIACLGNKIFVADGGGTVTIIDSEKMSILKHINIATESARCIAINPVLGEFAVGFSDNKIRVFDLQSLHLKHTIDAHANSVFCLQYSPDNQHLLSGSRDAHLKIWDTKLNYQLQESIVAHMYTINHMAYSPDGRLFATASIDKSIKIWDAARFKLLKVLDKARHAGHGTSVNKLCWSEYHDRLVSCSDDRTLSIWELSYNETAI